MTNRIGNRFYVFPQTWLGRAAGVVAAAALAVAAFFFFFVFLLVAGVTILGITLRLLWRGRRVRSGMPPDVLEGEYSVERGEQTVEITRRD